MLLGVLFPTTTVEFIVLSCWASDMILLFARAPDMVVLLADPNHHGPKPRRPIRLQNDLLFVQHWYIRVLLVVVAFD